MISQISTWKSSSPAVGWLFWGGNKRLKDSFLSIRNTFSKFGKGHFTLPWNIVPRTNDSLPMYHVFFCFFKLKTSWIHWLYAFNKSFKTTSCHISLQNLPNQTPALNHSPSAVAVERIDPAHLLLQTLETGRESSGKTIPCYRINGVGLGGEGLKFLRWEMRMKRDTPKCQTKNSQLGCVFFKTTN